MQYVLDNIEYSTDHPTLSGIALRVDAANKDAVLCVLLVSVALEISQLPRV